MSASAYDSDSAPLHLPPPPPVAFLQAHPLVVSLLPPSRPYMARDGRCRHPPAPAPAPAPAPYTHTQNALPCCCVTRPTPSHTWITRSCSRPTTRLSVNKKFLLPCKRILWQYLAGPIIFISQPMRHFIVSGHEVQ
jgi:hypothetical protein